MRGFVFHSLFISAPFLKCVLSVAAVLLPLFALRRAAAEENSHGIQLVEGKSEHSHSPEDCRGKRGVKVEICDWYGGASGAASISIDDSFASCRDILNRNGFKGTYYLSGTDKFTESDWDMWRAIHAEGHEIGCHTVTHGSRNILEEDILRWELSANRNHILTNMGIPEEELVSFAWPRGDASPGSKVVAGEYFLGARGYHINELEEKVPADFMYLKCLNTPHYHHPADDPPDYFEKADEAERAGKWVHFVFHNECLDDGAISYLSTKDLWVAPVGAVVKYIRERENSRVVNVANTDSKIAFTLACPLEPGVFNQELTISVLTDPRAVQTVLVNRIATEFIRAADYIRFNVRPSNSVKVVVPTIDLTGRTDRGIPEPNRNYQGSRSKLSIKLDAGDGAVINIWISGQERLDNLRNQRIKYLFVDVGDTSRDGKIETPITEIVQFLRMIKSYEKQHAYDFVILPYSEINTYRCELSRQFRENFIADYKGLMASGFDGIYVDVEPVRRSLQEDYLEFLNELSVLCPEPLVLAVYAGNVSDSQVDDTDTNEWQWSRSLYRDVSNLVDLTIVPGYDFNLRSRSDYTRSIRKQIELLSSELFNCHFMLAVPTHKREPETIGNALSAYNLEISLHPQHRFIGVCVFAEWTTSAQEWNVFKSEK